MSATEKPLTPRQARFAEEYLVDLNAKAAAIRAGYSPRSAEMTGSRLMSLDKVRAAVEAAKRERSEATRIDAEWVLTNAVRVFERCFQEVRPALHPKTRRQMKDEDGNLLFVFNAAQANRALELIGRHISVGAFEDRVQVNHEISIVERIQAGRARLARANVIDLDDYEIQPEPVAALPEPEKEDDL